MKTLYKTFSIIILIALMSSCSDDFLDLKPLDQEVSTSFYKTEDQAMQALVSIYDVLGYQETPGVSWAPFIVISDILSDDSYAGGSDANDGQDENEFNTFTIPTTSIIAHAIWLKNYTGIYRANLLLERIEEVDAADEFKKRLIAESKFLRAYFYFEQAAYFENIPLLINTLSGPSEYKQPQATPEQVYNQIALDLNEAITDLPASVTPAEAGRITKWAAQALLARVYLFYNGVYGKDLVAGSNTINKAVLVDYLDELIATSGHDLFENYQDNFKLVGEYGKESVFEISYGDTPPWWDWGYVRGGEGNLSAQMQGPRVANSTNWNRGWSFGTVSQKLVDDLKNDPRYQYTVLTQEELDGVLTVGYQHTGYFSKKYSSDAEHWGGSGQFELNRTCNHRVIRFSDVLLMAAELGSANAQQYLDRVRARVGLGSVPATPDNIYKERRLELSLEGIRYFDVLRKGLAYATQELTVTGVRGPNYVGEQQLFDVTFNAATKGFLPIPQTEMDLSGGAFVQNQGY
ncbi:MAG: RagB/SusD family nutrient uptake outer membrane protein [Lentimicrobium sp.]|uniref:RagB/SusD family nutrient uptake outer membrane protein n=1 Tax=Lentimicrobium sp. TaxID=2034841 RepID=UPI0025FCABD2|nr:RagB/SusD family nutrient uptake outer membrane protein [Lentimicrobium sp.]MCO5258448.1 RagB/SusD family nutrient uptake outer membrane protein [Lentimicrobium sp.]